VPATTLAAGVPCRVTGVTAVGGVDVGGGVVEVGGAVVLPADVLPVVEDPVVVESLRESPVVEPPPVQAAKSHPIRAQLESRIVRERPALGVFTRSMLDMLSSDFARNNVSPDGNGRNHPSPKERDFRRIFRNLRRARMTYSGL
jgi:hypothetical protein